MAGHSICTEQTEQPMAAGFGLSKAETAAAVTRTAPITINPRGTLNLRISA
jgi:hypothetical protein